MAFGSLSVAATGDAYAATPKIFLNWRNAIGPRCKPILSDQFAGVFAFNSEAFSSFSINLTFCAIAVEWLSRRCP